MISLFLPDSFHKQLKPEFWVYNSHLTTSAPTPQLSNALNSQLVTKSLSRGNIKNSYCQQDAPVYCNA